MIASNFLSLAGTAFDKQHLSRVGPVEADTEIGQFVFPVWFYGNPEPLWIDESSLPPLPPDKTPESPEGREKRMNWLRSNLLYAWTGCHDINLTRV